MSAQQSDDAARESLPSAIEGAMRARGEADARAQVEANRLGMGWQNMHYRAPVCGWEAVHLEGVPERAFILQVYPDGAFIRVREAAHGPARGGWFEHGGTGYATHDAAYNYIRGLYAKDGVR